MQKSIAFVVLFLLGITSYSQEYKFGYKFKKNFLKKAHLYKLGDTTLQRTDTVGILSQSQQGIHDSCRQIPCNSNPIVLTKAVQIEGQTYARKGIKSRLYASIKERSQDGIYDTLFINFWDFIDATFTTPDSVVNYNDNGEDFMLVIDTIYWQQKRNRSLKLPYRNIQFCATNLPFRVMTKSGEVESEFLNANISVVRVWGRTKIFRNEFIEPRNRAWGIGPYLGLSAIDNDVTDKTEFGLNYGANIIFANRDFNITAGYGFQNGFKKDTRKIRGYFGFGIGFKLVEFFVPEIEKKE